MKIVFTSILYTCTWYPDVQSQTEEGIRSTRSKSTELKCVLKNPIFFRVKTRNSSLTYTGGLPKNTSAKFVRKNRRRYPCVRGQFLSALLSLYYFARVLSLSPFWERDERVILERAFDSLVSESQNAKNNSNSQKFIDITNSHDSHIWTKLFYTRRSHVNKKHTFTYT